MRIIEPSYNILYLAPAIEVFALIELAGRTCYKSEEKIHNSFLYTDDNHNICQRSLEDTSAYKFIKNLLQHDPPHLSVIEHSMMTVRFVCDRGVSHELVRHRLCSFSQESTRYCNYSKGKFGNELTFIKPIFWNEKTISSNSDYETWYRVCASIEAHYISLIKEYGAKPEQARSILPNSIKTEIVVTANLRQWGYIFYQRTSNKAHPQMRQIIIPLLEEVQNRIPIIFDNLSIYR